MTMREKQIFLDSFMASVSHLLLLLGKLGDLFGFIFGLDFGKLADLFGFIHGKCLPLTTTTGKTGSNNAFFKDN